MSRCTRAKIFLSEGIAFESLEFALAQKFWIESHADPVTGEGVIILVRQNDALSPSIKVESAGANKGHGHIVPRADGVKARCGGPGICTACTLEKEELDKSLKEKKEPQSHV